MAKTPREREAIFRLRYEVLVAKMARFAGEADHEARRLRDGADDGALHLVALHAHGGEARDPADTTCRSAHPPSGEVRAEGALRIQWGGARDFSPDLRRAYALDRFARALRPEEICVADRLVVAESYRAGALVQRLAYAAGELLERNAIQAVLLACEPHQLDRNLALGFRPLDLAYSYPDIGIVVVLLGIVRDVEHLERLSSPLARMARTRSVHDEKCVEGLRALLPARPAVSSPLLAGEGPYRAEMLARLRAVGAAALDVFGTRDEPTIARALDRSNVIRCRPPCLVASARGASRMVYVVLDGRLRVDADAARPALTLGPGASFGGHELARVRGRNVRAETPVELLALHPTVIASATESQPA